MSGMEEGDRRLRVDTSRKTLGHGQGDHGLVASG
jgi:hypothetical protein